MSKNKHAGNKAGKVSSNKRKGASGQVVTYDRLAILVMCLLVGVVPLIVYLRYLPVGQQFLFFKPTGFDSDFFGYYKGIMTVVGAGALAVILALGYTVGGKFSAMLDQISRWGKLPLISLSIFVIAVVLSALLSPFPAVALNGGFTRYEGVLVWIAYLLLFGAAFLVLRNSKAKKVLAVTFVGSAVIVVGFALLQAMGADPYKWTTFKLMILPAQFQQYVAQIKFNFADKRFVCSVFSNSNYYGSYAALLIPLLLAALLGAKGKAIKAGSAALLIVSCYTLYMSKSAAGMVASIVAAMLVLVLFAVKRMIGKKAGHRSAVAAAMLVALLCVPAAQAFGTSLHAPGHRGNEAVAHEQTAEMAAASTTAFQPWLNPPESGSAVDKFADNIIIKYGSLGSNRVYIWARALQMAQHTVFIGHGADTFALFFPQQDPINTKLYGVHTIVDKPHNMYIQILIGFGAIALLAFIVLMLAILGRGFMAILRKDSRAEDLWLDIGLWAAMLGFLIVSMFNDSVCGISQIFWIFAGMVAASGVVGKSKKKVSA